MLHTTLFFIFSLSTAKPMVPHLNAEPPKKEAAPKRFDFDDDIVVGEGAGPLYDVLTQRPKTKFGSLLPIRENFDHELMKSVYDL